MRMIRRWFITGLVVLLPVLVTVWALVFGFNLLDGLWRSILPLVLGRYVPGVGTLLTVTLTIAVGAVATNVIGRRLIGWAEALLQRIPIVRSVYSAAKQFVDVVAGGQKAAFQRVVLVEYPRRGTYAIGFLTATGPQQVSEAVGEEIWSVFLPTSPNPTTGWVVLLPRSQCRTIPMSVEEAFRIIVSGGVLAAGNTAAGPAGPSARPPDRSLTGAGRGSS